MSRALFLVGLIGLGAACLFCASICAESELDSVVAAIIRRQARISSFTYKVRGESQDRTHGQEWRRHLSSVDVAWAEGKLRVDTHEQQLMESAMEPVDISLSGVTTGDMQVFRQAGSGTVGPGASRLREDPRVKPLVYAHCLFTPLSNVDIQRVRFLGHAERDGHPCVVIEEPTGYEAGTYRTEWWLAEDMDHSVVMWRSFSSEELCGQTTIRYISDEQVGWRVLSSSRIMWEQGRTVYTVECQVNDAVFNQAVDPETFQITFEPGTRVFDVFRKVGYIAGEDGLDPTHALLDQGRMEEFVEKTREELGSLDPRDRYRPRRWPWIAGGVGALVLLAGAGRFMLLRRRKARRA